MTTTQWEMTIVTDGVCRDADGNLLDPDGNPVITEQSDDSADDSTEENEL